MAKPNREKRHSYLERLWEQQRGSCFYCQKPLKRVTEVERDPNGRVPSNAPTIDHLHPRNHGGGWHYSNLVMACFRCNHIKGNRLVPDQILTDKSLMTKLFRSGHILKVLA